MSKLLNVNVWGQVGLDEISRKMFYAIIASTLVWGFILTYIISILTADMHHNLLTILLIGLGLPIIGIIISAKSKNPFVSFIGFNLVVIGISFILGPILNMYESQYSGIVSESALLTACITFIMGASGIIFPNFYSKIGGALFIALICLLIISSLGLFFESLRFEGLSYIAATIFALYIGYDMWRASQIPATYDNAIDVCVSLYLDIINLFLRILEILAKNRR